MYHIARQGLHQLCEQSSLVLRIHTAKNTECYIRMKLVAHDNTVPLIRLLWLKNPIRTVQKRVSESVDERYLCGSMETTDKNDRETIEPHQHIHWQNTSSEQYVIDVNK